MCGSPDKQRPSANEIALAEAAGIQDQQFEQDFLPLEVFEIEQFNDPAVERVNRNLLAGRQNADVASAERDANQSLILRAQASGAGLGSQNNFAGADEIALATGEGVGQAKVDSRQAARKIRDAEGLNIIRTGQRVNRTATSGLSTLARSDNFRAGERLRAKQTENAARAEALGDIAAAGIGGGLRRFSAILAERKSRNKAIQAGNDAGPFPAGSV